MDEFLDMRAETERDGAGPDLRILLVRGVVRSLPWVCLLVVLGGLAGIVVGLMQPDTYVSKAKLLLRLGAREQMTSDSLFGPDEGQRAPPPTMLDELQLLSDVAVYENVARKIGPSEILRPADPRSNDGPLTPAPTRLLHGIQAHFFRWAAPPHACAGEECASCLRAATKHLVDDTTITNELGSNVIVLSHVSTSPEKARTIAQALMNGFIERHRDQFSIQFLVDKNRSKLELAKKARDEAADAYVQEMSRVGLVDLDVQGPALAAEINTSEKELFDARVRREEIKRQRASMTERLTGVPSEIEVQHAPVMVPNEEYETQVAYKLKLLDQKATLPARITTKEEKRRIERELDDQIAQVDAKIKTLPHTVSQSSERRENAGYANRVTRIEDLESEDQALAVKIDMVAARLSEKQQRLGEIRKQGLGVSLHRKDLASARDAAETNYKHVLERFSVLDALGSVDVGDANLRVVQMPTLDTDSSGPKRLGLILKGLLAGALAGAAFAVLRQRFDKKLRYPEQLEHTRDLPLVSVVPDLPALRRRPRTVLAEGSS